MNIKILKFKDTESKKNVELQTRNDVTFVYAKLCRSKNS